MLVAGGTLGAESPVMPEGTIGEAEIATASITATVLARIGRDTTVKKP